MGKPVKQEEQEKKLIASPKKRESGTSESAERAEIQKQTQKVEHEDIAPILAELEVIEG